MHSLAKKLFRTELFPFMFCPGCGDGTIVQMTARAIDELGIMDDVATVGAIGCSSWMGSYLNVDFIKVLHGRALPVATGLKLTKPSRKVIVFMGDGDALAIGGNHFMHAARRNIDLTVILVNNEIYGMTGGQVAPTTPQGATTMTSPYGNLEQQLDSCELAKAAGATFVSRWSVAQPRQLLRAIKKGIEHPGFALIEAISLCPTQAGRYMKGTGDPVKLMNELKNNCISIKNAAELSEEEKQSKYVIGDFYEAKKPEFAERLYAKINELQAK
jgi:2-oxoglutarate ferredoxin oxidoreductase subunit beta